MLGIKLKSWIKNSRNPWIGADGPWSETMGWRARWFVSHEPWRGRDEYIWPVRTQTMAVKVNF